jgi:hypothetical protein
MERLKACQIFTWLEVRGPGQEARQLSAIAHYKEWRFPILKMKLFIKLIFVKCAFQHADN